MEKSSKPPAIIGCLDCRTEARFGVDGAWVGATKDNSYVVISLNPGVHHLCAVRGKEVDAQPLTVEAGKTYYYQVEYKAEGTQYGTPEQPNYQVKKNVSFAMLNEDEGQYLVQGLCPEYREPEEIATCRQFLGAIIGRLFQKNVSSSSVRHPGCALLA